MLRLRMAAGRLFNVTNGRAGFICWLPYPVFWCPAVFLRSKLIPLLAMLLPLVACGGGYSPDVYATRAVQQANKVEQGVVAGVRRINVVAGGETGAAAGAAAGGVLGSQAPTGIFSALGGVGGAVIGGLAGSAAEHRFVDTVAWEYVVRVTGKTELISVTQRDERPLAVGQKVLVIAGNQARIVPDYIVAAEPPAAPTPLAAAPQPTPEATPEPVVEPARAEALLPSLLPAGIAAPPAFPRLPPPVWVPQPAPPLPAAPSL